MLLEYMGLEKKTFPDNTWIEVSKNAKNIEEFNNIVLLLQIDSSFELFFDLVFIGLLGLSSFMIFYFCLNLKKVFS